MHMARRVAAWVAWAVWTCNTGIAGCSQKRAGFGPLFFCAPGRRMVHSWCFDSCKPHSLPLQPLRITAVHFLPRLAIAITACLVFGIARADTSPPRTFSVWVFADAHVGTDKAKGRDSLAAALQQSEGASGFAWDIALDLGDVSGAQGTPKDDEGKELVRQFGVLQRHRREQIYDLSGTPIDGPFQSKERGRAARLGWEICFS